MYLSPLSMFEDTSILRAIEQVFDSVTMRRSSLYNCNDI